MGKRNIEIKVRLNRKEAELLNKHVKKSRLSREAYLRHLINGLVPQDAPPPAYFDFMRELHSIGNNLNQIAQKAHVLGVMDERRYDEALQRFDQLIRDITKAVILPKPMDMRGNPALQIKVTALASSSSKAPIMLSINFLYRRIMSLSSMRTKA